MQAMFFAHPYFTFPLPLFFPIPFSFLLPSLLYPLPTPFPLSPGKEAGRALIVMAANAFLTFSTTGNTSFDKRFSSFSAGTDDLFPRCNEPQKTS